jgi:hypothetical protein
MTTQAAAKATERKGCDVCGAADWRRCTCKPDLGALRRELRRCIESGEYAVAEELARVLGQMEGARG